MKLKLFALSVLMIVSFNGCGDKSNDTTSSADTLKETPKKTEYNLVNIDNKPMTVKVMDNAITVKEPEFKDKVILVNFFATWCPPCRAEIPHLKNLVEKYNGKFDVIAVMLDEGLSLEDKKAFVDKFGINYKVSTTQTENHALASTIGNVRTIPYMMLFDPSGKFVTDYKGAVPEEMIESDIKKALGSK
jgi:thiol-disulfide isomerase/thioredoxin